MPRPLFALCLPRGGQQLEVKRVRLSGDLQGQVEGLFDQQYLSFTEGVDEDVPFTGSYKPEASELLVVPTDVVSDVDILLAALAQNALALPELSPSNLIREGIKALLMEGTEADTILVQKFTQAQVLSRKFLLVFSGDVYRRFSEPVFALDTSLTFVIDGGFIKFKVFDKLRSILDVKDLYRSATDAEVIEFAQHDNFAVSDLEHFVGLADQPSRRDIGAIMASGFLSQFTATELKQIASRSNLQVKVTDDKLVLPDTRRGLKDILQFLREQRFIGMLSGRVYIANSVRPAGD